MGKQTVAEPTEAKLCSTIKQALGSRQPTIGYLRQYSHRQIQLHAAVPVYPSQWHKLAYYAGRGKMQRPMAKRDQEDAQEFLGYLLDHLHEELLSLKTTLKDSLQLQGKQLENLVLSSCLENRFLTRLRK